MKPKQIIPLVFTILGIGLAPFSYWCIYTNQICYGTFLHNIYQYFTNPLYNFCFYFLPTAIMLIFIPRPVFYSWLKFAAWGIPLAAIFIWTTPVTSSAWMDFFPFYRDDAARLAGGLFTLISLALIAWKYRSFRNNRL